MLEYEKKHTRGRKTFIYTFIRLGWWLVLIACGIFYITWLIYYGPLHDTTAHFLVSHPNWYVDVPMLSMWLVLIGISVLIIAYLEASVHYRYYKFILDEYAVHLHRGLFFIRETTIPYRQISNVHIDRPYHYRMFGIAKLDIVTAADKSMEQYSNGKENNKSNKFFIPIIDTSLARILSRQLLECAHKVRSGEDVYEDEELEEEDTEEADEPEDLDKLDEDNKTFY